jgi:hypothetical protein
MARTLDDYRRKLMDKIIFSSCTDDVLRFSDTAVRSLNDHRVHSYIIIRFIDKTIRDLEEFAPLCIDENQRRNIRSAVDHFRQLRKRLASNAVAE